MFDLEDPKTLGLLYMAAGMMQGGPGKANFAADMSRGLFSGLQGYQGARAVQARDLEEQQQRQMRDMQMQQMRRGLAQQQQVDELAPKFFSSGQPLTPNDDEGNRMPLAPASMDYHGYANALTGIDPMRGLQLQQQLAAMQAKERVKVAPGETIGTYQGNTFKPDYSAPDKPPAGFMRGPDGKLVADPEWMKAQVEIATAKRPSISVTTGNTMAGELGKGTGELLNTGRTSAVSAIDTITTGNQVRQALDSGKVMAGPGTTNVKIPLAQIAPMFGLASDPEGLVRTRQVITGMANQSLNARGLLKGQGQISDFEGKVLEKAKSGNIDSMTVPEIRALIDVNERAARVQIQRHNALVDQLAKNPQFAEVIPFFRVEEPAAYQKQGPNLADIEAEILRRRGRGP